MIAHIILRGKEYLPGVTETYFWRAIALMEYPRQTEVNIEILMPIHY